MNSRTKCGIYLLSTIGCFYLLTNSCTQELLPQGIALGDSLQGGKVAYILQPGDPGYDPQIQHGLIAGPSDTTEGIMPWSIISEPPIGTTGTALGTGLANTESIIAIHGEENYAAKYCYDLEYNGFTDWYLPSKDELDKLCKNFSFIGGFYPFKGNNYYWSSSEFIGNNKMVWMHVFYPADFPNIFPKTVTCHVRCVRSF